MAPSVEPGKKYFLRIPDGGVVSQIHGRYTDDDVYIRPKDSEHNRDYQKWEAVSSHGLFGFRSLRNQKFLGPNNNGDLTAVAPQIKGWEEFFVDNADGRHHLAVKKDDKWQTVDRAKYSDSLSLSDGSYVPIEFEPA